AGGKGEEQDLEILNGLIRIYYFLLELYEGRNNYRQTSFQPLPLLARISLEQIEEEGANEELEALMSNKGYFGGVQGYANSVKSVTLNCFFHSN
ncbi:MAG: hypothetical protein EZS28_016735, partial [Streblomastix strix]